MTASALLLLATLAALLLASCARSLPGVTSVTAVTNGTSIDLSWQAVAGATAYDVFLSTNPSVSPRSYSQEVIATGTSAVISGHTTGTTYYIIVTATSLVLFAASASDTDGDTLTYTWTVTGSTVAGPTANLNLYSWTAPSPATPTTYTAGVQVTDGTTTASATTTVTVQ